MTAYLFEILKLLDDQSVGGSSAHSIMQMRERQRKGIILMGSHFSALDNISNVYNLAKKLQLDTTGVISLPPFYTQIFLDV